MNSYNDSTSEKKPLYKRPRLYIYSVVIALLSIFLILFSTVVALRWINPSFTSFTLQQEWDELGVERYSLKEYWVPAEQIPVHSQWAVVGAEDQLFWEHNGFDFESIREAWDDRQEGVRSRGASTITQQVAKNLFLWPAESFFRKGIEAVITVLIELTWPKERIIEVYLNIAEFGPGIFGIGKAAEEFYQVPASSLEPEMSSRLAAVLPNPKRMRVNPPSPFAEERSAWILRQMTRLSGIAYIEIEDTTQTTPDSTISIQSIQPDSLGTRFINDQESHFDEPDSLLFSTQQDTISENDSSEIEMNIDSTKAAIDSTGQ